MAEYKKVVCPQCKGTGFIKVPFDPILKDCPACGGTGIVARDIEREEAWEAMNVGGRIRSVRKKANLTQVEVAEMAGIAVNSLRLYEAGKRIPNVSTLGKIAEALGVLCFDILNCEPEERLNKQEAKADAGKPRLSLVPTQIIYDIARVREYGDKKYGSTDNWKTVETQRYVDAMFRHLLAFVKDPDGRDEESGLPHLWHLECNAAFLSEMMKGRWQ